MSEARFLTVPMGDTFAYIPLSVTQEDYDLLIATMELWKNRIAPEVKPESETKEAL